MKNSFVLYTEINEVVKELTNEEKGMLFQAILDYQISGSVPQLPKDLRLFFLAIKIDLDKNNKRYEEIVQKRKEAGKKGGEAKASTSKQNVANAKSDKQNKANLTNVADNDNDNDNVNDNDDVIKTNVNNNNKGATKVADVISECPVELQDTMKAFVEHRKTIKKPLSVKATELIIGKALKLANNDLQQANKIIEQSIERGWQGVFPLDDKTVKTSKLDELKQAWNELEQQKGVLLNE